MKNIFVVDSHAAGRGGSNSDQRRSAQGPLTPGTPTGTAWVVVTTQAGGASTAVTIPLSSMASGLFDITLPNGDSTGVHRPAAYNNSDYSVPLPTNVTIGSFTSRPSSLGEVVVLWATGLGQVTNPPSDGQAGRGSPPYSVAMTLPTVMVGGVQAQVLSAVLSPQFPTIYRIANNIPATAPVTRFPCGSSRMGSPPLAAPEPTSRTCSPIIQPTAAGILAHGGFIAKSGFLRPEDDLGGSDLRC